MSFQFDTSGVVTLVQAPFDECPRALRHDVRWSDLSPFPQGYVEGLFDWAYHDGTFAAAMKAGRRDMKLPGFADLSPEALAMILGDCERFAEVYGERHPQSHAKYFFLSRQEGRLSQFPPLTVYLGDDGKVRLAVAS